MTKYIFPICEDCSEMVDLNEDWRTDFDALLCGRCYNDRLDFMDTIDNTP